MKTKTIQKHEEQLNRYLEKKYSGVSIFCLVIIAMLGGILIGMVLQLQLLYLGLESSLRGLEGTTFNVEVDFNETFMTDRLTGNMKPILWDIRMQNCTKTEKGYCAIECYENGYLMPCENFTGTEVFCNNGKCEIDGVCPTYYEQLRGKTLTDCILELENNDKLTKG